MIDKYIDKCINQVIQGDCLEVMKNIPDNSVDITFADPPFNLKKRYNGYKDNKKFNVQNLLALYSYIIFLNG